MSTFNATHSLANNTTFALTFDAAVYGTKLPAHITSNTAAISAAKPKAIHAAICRSLDATFNATNCAAVSNSNIAAFYTAKQSAIK